MSRATGPALIVVATPIGNLEDLSLRAIRVLRTATLVCAEDTRTARHLLARIGTLSTEGTANLAEGADVPDAQGRRVMSVFDGNEQGRVAEVCDVLAAGTSVALISEAGTPGISDPGQRLIAAVIAAGHRIEVVPGPVAAIHALVASGLPTDAFLFLGFPPRDVGARQQLFGARRAEPATMVFYEAPDRVGATLRDLLAAFGPERRACVGRELTKMFEEHARGTLAELAARYADVSPRGECTLVVAGATASSVVAELDLDSEVRALLARGLGPKDVAAQLVVRTGKPRRQLYQLALSLARTSPDVASDPDA